MNFAINIRDLKFSWDKSHSLVISSFQVKPGEKVFVRGESGSGKSTLLNLISGVIDTRAGVLEVLGSNFCGMSAARKDAFRSQKIGIIFQQFNLIPFLTVRDNLNLRAHFQSHSALDDAALIRLLEQLSLDARLLPKRVNKLSVGQQQRVAALRALMGKPELILADEPSSSLDYKNTDSFMKLLLQQSAGKTVLFVSHDDRLAAYFDRTVDVHDFIQWQAGADA